VTATQHVSVRRIPGSHEQPDELVVEEPLEIVLRWQCDDEVEEKTIAITMRTPGDDRALAAGFLFTEGVVAKPEDIARIEVPDVPNRVLVVLRSDLQPDLKSLERHFYTNSSCGICGKTSLEALRAVAVYPIAKDGLNIEESVLRCLPEGLLSGQGAFAVTGSAHAAALFNSSGEILDLAEDVGRHNALDKLIGRALLTGSLPLSDSGILLSGRAGFELVQKARMAASPLLACVGAPSSLAVDLAWESGITLLGFLRAEGFNIYSCPSRVIDGSAC
jgi:FdhD protein